MRLKVKDVLIYIQLQICSNNGQLLVCASAILTSHIIENTPIKTWNYLL